MTYSIDQAAVPGILQTLGVLSSLLDKAAAHAKARGIKESDLLAYRLAPDMFDLKRQIQIATDQAKGCVARLGGVEVPKYEDTETTIKELKARIAKTVKFVKSVKPKQFAGAEDRELVIRVGKGEMHFSGRDYLTGWFQPNFYFHAAAAYMILRHAGVAIGKRDFLSA